MNWYKQQLKLRYKEASLKENVVSILKGLGLSSLIWATVFLGYGISREIIERNRNNPEAIKQDFIREVEKQRKSVSMIREITPSTQPKTHPKHHFFGKK